MNIITIDKREPDGMEELFETFTSFKLERKMITEDTDYPTGDYCYKGKILIERKTIQDFDSSFLSNHIWEQCQKMRIWANQDLTRVVRLYIVGDLGVYNEHSGITFEQRMGAIESIAGRYNITVVTPQSETQMVVAIGKMCRMLDEGKMGIGREFQFLPAKNITLLEHLLGGINGIGKDRVKNIMEYINESYFKDDEITVWKFLNALHDEILILPEIDGIGPKLDEKIKFKTGVWKPDEDE